MKIHCTPDGDLDILRLTGDFDTSAAQPFNQAIDRLIDEHRTDLIVDLSGVAYLGSPGVSCLIRAQRHLRPLAGQLVLAGPRRIALRTLKTVGFDALTRIFLNVEAARAHFDAPDRARPLDLEGVPVDEKLAGRVDVSFGPAGDRGREAKGKLLVTYDDGLMIHCPHAAPESLGIDQLDVGTRLWVRFRQPLLARGREFDVETAVAYAYDDAGSDSAKYRLLFTKITDEEARLMREFAGVQDDVRAYGKPLPAS